MHRLLFGFALLLFSIAPAAAVQVSVEQMIAATGFNALYCNAGANAYDYQIANGYTQNTSFTVTLACQNQPAVNAFVLVPAVSTSPVQSITTQAGMVQNTLCQLSLTAFDPYQNENILVGTFYSSCGINQNPGGSDTLCCYFCVRCLIDNYFWWHNFICVGLITIGFLVFIGFLILPYWIYTILPETRKIAEYSRYGNYNAANPKVAKRNNSRYAVTDYKNNDTYIPDVPDAFNAPEDYGRKPGKGPLLIEDSPTKPLVSTSTTIKRQFGKARMAAAALANASDAPASPGTSVPLYNVSAHRVVGSAKATTTETPKANGAARDIRDPFPAEGHTIV